MAESRLSVLFRLCVAVLNELIDKPGSAAFGRSLSENVDAVVGDDHRLLELRRALAVDCHRRPLVRPVCVLPAARIDHGLDCEAMIFRHYARRAVLCK